MVFVFELPLKTITSEKINDFLPGLSCNNLKFENVTSDKQIVIKNWNNEKECRMDSEKINIKISKLMLYFDENNNEYPKSSVYLCHHCCHSFKTVPCFIPSINEETICTSGNFCSFNCALSYVCDYSSRFPENTIEMLRFLHRKITNSMSPLTPALPKEVLKDFGGNMDITEYRNNLIIPNITHNIFYPPIIPSIPILELRIKTPLDEGDIKFKKKTQNKIKQTTIFS